MKNHYNADKGVEKTMKNIKFKVTLLGLASFLIICGMVVSNLTIHFDNTVQGMIFYFRNFPLTQLFVGITYLGNWQMVVLLCFIFLAIKRTRMGWGIPLSCSVAISTIINKGIKMTVERPRPEIANQLIEQGGFSFPSGHAMTGIVFYGLIAYLIIKNGHKKSAQRTQVVGLVILIAMIGVSRVYLGLHYPTDVLAGWCLGVTILVLAIILIESPMKKNEL